MSEFFKSQLLDKEKKSIVFSELRRLRRLEIEEKKNDPSWRERDYKLYPSGGYQLSCCPWYEIQHMDEPRTFQLENWYKMKAGTAKHKEIQDDLLKSNLLYFPDGTHPGLYLGNGYMRQEIRADIEKQWPEVPYRCPKSGFSMRVDGVLKIDDHPAVIEIKTTSVPPDKWEEYKQKYLPDKKHFSQVLICTNRLNLSKLYSKPIKQFGLVYLNLMMPIGDQSGEIEFWFPYSEELKQQSNLLIANFTKERKMYIENRESSCSYSNCYRHREKKE